jgi:hypothetical protein
MKWLQRNLCPCDENTFAEAVGYGNLYNIKLLLENNCPWEEDHLENSQLNNYPPPS